MSKPSDDRPSEEIPQLKESWKKAKLDDKSDCSSNHILTFCLDDNKNVKIQLLPSHSVYDLISTLCDNVSIGESDDTANDHMWFIEYKDKKYESGEHECESPLRANDTQLKDLKLDLSSIIFFHYDYGAGFRYRIHFLGVEESEEAIETYPRLKPVPLPSGYEKYVPADISINLDTTFASLQKWIFQSTSVTLHFFQPGRKKNWGFFKDSGYAMLYLPVKPENLNDYLSYFDQGAACPRKGMEEGGDGYPHYDWHSVVIIPKSKSTSALESKYARGSEAGFCDCVNANDGNPNIDMNSVFPKLSALAGWKKDAKVPKGWMTFVKKDLKCSITVYKGNSQNHKNNAPPGTAYDGDKQHDPVDDAYLGIDGLEIKGLYDLFCVAEGLLRSR